MADIRASDTTYSEAEDKIFWQAYSQATCARNKQMRRRSADPLTSFHSEPLPCRNGALSQQEMQQQQWECPSYGNASCWSTHQPQTPRQLYCQPHLRRHTSLELHIERQLSGCSAGSAMYATAVAGAYIEGSCMPPVADAAAAHHGSAACSSTGHSNSTAASGHTYGRSSHHISSHSGRTEGSYSSNHHCTGHSSSCSSRQLSTHYQEQLGHLDVDPGCFASGMISEQGGSLQQHQQRSASMMIPDAAAAGYQDYTEQINGLLVDVMEMGSRLAEAAEIAGLCSSRTAGSSSHTAPNNSAKAALQNQHPIRQHHCHQQRQHQQQHQQHQIEVEGEAGRHLLRSPKAADCSSSSSSSKGTSSSSKHILSSSKAPAAAGAAAGASCRPACQEQQQWSAPLAAAPALPHAAYACSTHHHASVTLDRSAHTAAQRPQKLKYPQCAAARVHASAAATRCRNADAAAAATYCCNAAAAAAAHKSLVASAAHLARRGCLSGGAQAKLRELLAVQQRQLQLQHELLQMLSISA